jgi:hypothetical protein
MCDNPGSTKQELLAEIREQVLRFGWSIQYVESDRNPYGYTVGLHERGLPELLVTGLLPQPTVALLNEFAEISGQGERLRPGERLTFGHILPIEVVRVQTPDAHMDTAVAFYGRQFPALQLVWADGAGRWPWSIGFCDGDAKQPVLGVRASRTRRRRRK